MTTPQNGSPRGFLIYDSTYNQLSKCFTPQQIGEFIKLAGEYIMYGNKEVESDDPLVDTMLQMSKPTLDSAERRHRAAVENGMKGAEHGKKGGRPKKDNQPPKENPQITPIKPLEKEIEDEKEVEIKKEKDIKNNIDIDKEIDSSNTSNIYSNKLSNNISTSNLSSFNDSISIVENNPQQPTPPTNTYDSDFFASITLTDDSEPLNAQSKRMFALTPQERAELIKQVQEDVRQLAMARRGHRIEGSFREIYERATDNTKRLYGYRRDDDAIDELEDIIAETLRSIK